MPALTAPLTLPPTLSFAPTINEPIRFFPYSAQLVNFAGRSAFDNSLIALVAHLCQLHSLTAVEGGADRRVLALGVDARLLD